MGTTSTMRVLLSMRYAIRIFVFLEEAIFDTKRRASECRSHTIEGNGREEEEKKTMCVNERIHFGRSVIRTLALWKEKKASK